MGKKLEGLVTERLGRLFAQKQILFFTPTSKQDTTVKSNQLDFEVFLLRFVEIVDFHGYVFTFELAEIRGKHRST